MKIISVALENFGSYESLDLDFKNQGTVLVNGPTGAGKSTLMDAIPWVLFGRTAKDGNVDEVLSWPGDKITHGHLVLKLNDGQTMAVFRSRGRKAKDNDLAFDIGGHDDLTRGKDMIDTQRMIEEKLGITAAAFLASSYYHEFSQTAQFFTATAKNRRLLCEQLADLSLPKKLQDKLTEQRKKDNKELTEFQTKQRVTQSSIDTQEALIITCTRNAQQWSTKQYDKIDNLIVAYETFDADKKERISANAALVDKLLHEAISDASFLSLESSLVGRITNLPEDRCHECGSLKASDAKAKLNNELSQCRQRRALNKTKLHMLKTAQENGERIAADKNTYLEQLEEAKSEINPHTKLLEEMIDSLEISKNKLSEIETNLAASTEKMNDAELLSDIVTDMRSRLVKSTVVGLERQTNDLLSKHFDAEIRVTFDVQDADKIDVTITKDGNQCVYTQLSKGQRQLLKLSFGIAVMKQVSNHSGVSTNVIMLDEAMDGLDEAMKLKAFGMIKSLESSYESIFLVDHSPDLKAMVDTQYVVSLVNGRSQIAKTQ